MVLVGLMVASGWFDGWFWLVLVGLMVGAGWFDGWFWLVWWLV